MMGDPLAPLAGGWSDEASFRQHMALWQEKCV
jgi:hypothetical protein